MKIIAEIANLPRVAALFGQMFATYGVVSNSGLKPLSLQEKSSKLY
jgi:hypothetical protein